MLQFKIGLFLGQIGATGPRGNDGPQGEEGPQGLSGLPGEMVDYLLITIKKKYIFILSGSLMS